MSPTPSLDWTLPIYTVPDERNPVPVRCEVVEGDERRLRFAGVWVNLNGFDMGHMTAFYYQADGTPDGAEGFLPRLQNLPEETA